MTIHKFGVDTKIQLNGGIKVSLIIKVYFQQPIDPYEPLSVNLFHFCCFQVVEFSSVSDNINVVTF